MNRPERLALTQRHAGILTLGINTDNRPIGGQQIGDDRADALARACRCDGDRVARQIQPDLR